jgi:hypothetical protein
LAGFSSMAARMAVMRWAVAESRQLLSRAKTRLAQGAARRSRLSEVGSPASRDCFAGAGP